MVISRTAAVGQTTIAVLITISFAFAAVIVIIIIIIITICVFSFSRFSRATDAAFSRAWPAINGGAYRGQTGSDRAATGEQNQKNGAPRLPCSCGCSGLVFPTLLSHTIF